MKNQVNLFKTRIYANTDALKILQNLLENNYTDSGKVILADDHTFEKCLPLLKKNCHSLKKALVITIKHGEENKTIDTAQYIWQQLNENFIDRNAIMINLGGGMVTDIGSFCASTYKRGINFINVPTTLLGMVDAAIGGKTALDIKQYKNIIGTFAMPEAIFISLDFLKTLDERNLNCGKAEMIKHALISGKNTWKKISSIAFEELINTQQIFNSLKIKCNIVKKDPYEKAHRKVLNFGHTIGHAVESWSLKNQDIPLLHGECVAIGMVMESYLSYKHSTLKKSDAKKIAEFIDANYLLKKFDTRSISTIIDYMQYDKKNKNANINFTLLDSIGQASINHYCTKKSIAEAFDFFNSIAE